MTGKIIVIEGTDFSGKTTTAKNLASNIGAMFFACPKGETQLSETLYERLKSDTVDARTKDAITLALHVENSKRILCRASEGQDIVVDRNYLSLLAYAQNYFRDFITMNQHYYKLFEPDLTVILYAQDDILLKRYAERNELDALDEYFKDNIKRISYFYEYVSKRFARNQLKIDTSNTTINEVVERIQKES